MNEQYGPGRWLPWVIGLVLAAVVATVAYNAGLTQGLAAQGAAAAPVVYRWHGFGPFWLLIILFWFLAIFRRGWWGWGGPRYWGYYRGYRNWDDEVPPGFDEWHRRAHEREKTGTTGPPQG